MKYKILYKTNERNNTNTNKSPINIHILFVQNNNN